MLPLSRVVSAPAVLALPHLTRTPVRIHSSPPPWQNPTLSRAPVEMPGPQRLVNRPLSDRSRTPSLHPAPPPLVSRLRWALLPLPSANHHRWVRPLQPSEDPRRWARPAPRLASRRRWDKNRTPSHPSLHRPHRASVRWQPRTRRTRRIPSGNHHRSDRSQTLSVRPAPRPPRLIQHPMRLPNQFRQLASSTG